MIWIFFKYEAGFKQEVVPILGKVDDKISAFIDKFIASTFNLGTPEGIKILTPANHADKDKTIKNFNQTFANLKVNSGDIVQIIFNASKPM